VGDIKTRVYKARRKLRTKEEEMKTVIYPEFKIEKGIELGKKQKGPWRELFNIYFFIPFGLYVLHWSFFPY
jgi:hypothetical protein